MIILVVIVIYFLLLLLLLSHKHEAHLKLNKQAQHANTF